MIYSYLYRKFYPISHSADIRMFAEEDREKLVKCIRFFPNLVQVWIIEAVRHKKVDSSIHFGNDLYDLRELCVGLADKVASCHILTVEEKHIINIILCANKYNCLFSGIISPRVHVERILSQLSVYRTEKNNEKCDEPLAVPDREQSSGCKFCDHLEWREYMVPERNRMDTDNLCQCLSWGRIDGSVETGSYASFSCPENCGGCIENNVHFGLFTRENRIGFSYSFKSKNLKIDRNSEMLTINFCPWCGRQLSNKTVPFEKSCINFEMGSIMLEK